jgi:antitoxin ChpS
MELALKKYGNSTVAVLPPSVLKKVGLRSGQLMSLKITKDGKIVLSAKKRYSLSELLSQCDLKSKPPKDLDLWDNSKPAGQEVGVGLEKFIGFLSNKTNKALTIDEINDATQKAWSKSE